MILSIIIVSYNTKELLEQCLESIQASLKGKSRLKNSKTQKLQNSNFKSQIPNQKLSLSSLEVIIVDNNSTDGSQEYLAKLKAHPPKLTARLSGVYPPEAELVERNRRVAEGKNSKTQKLQIPNIKVILNKENAGFSKANNQGIKIAKGEYVLLLNSDTIVQEGALEKMVAFMEKNKKVGGISPLLLNADGSPQIDYYMRFPNLGQIFFYHNRLLRPVFMSCPLLAKTICFLPQKRPYSVDQLPGAAMMVRKSVFEKVGLLDEDYPFYFEDVDWSWQAKKRGELLLVLPEAKITHLGGGSWKKGQVRPEKYYRQFFASMKLFAQKNYPPLKRKILLWAIDINFGLKGLVKKMVASC